MTEQTSDGGKLFVANAAGLVSMKRLLDRMIQEVDSALREGRIGPNDMLRMQTTRFITNPMREHPWRTPGHFVAVALTDCSNLPDRLMDPNDDGTQIA